MSESNRDFSRAFRDGARLPTYADELVVVEIRRVGDLLLPTGTLVVCDPFWIAIDFRLDRHIPPGRYPVLLSVAHLGNDQRVALALLQLADQVPSTWQPAAVRDAAVPAGPNTQSEGKPPGYGVDSGTAAFMDALAARRLGHASGGESLLDALDSILDQNYVPTWAHASLVVDPPSGANVVAFSSGFGDGAYGCYWGLASNGEVTAVVTNFDVLDLAPRSG